MEPLSQLEELLVCRLDTSHREAEPCTVVIFGASGDLTSRKLIPALYHLHAQGHLPSATRIIGFARREKSSDSWREEMQGALQQYSRAYSADVWNTFGACLHYCQGDLSDAAAYRRLAEFIHSFEPEVLRRHVLFYLAVSPSQFGEVARQLDAAGLLVKEEPAGTWRRLVIEKPFGHDMASARQLNEQLTRHAHERQIFRIDHYLGKETVQNILMFRFSNSIFEPLWNRQFIDHVQLTVSEKLGVGGRGGYYEESGALRDMVQNHLLQVLALAAMEPPVSLEAEAIRDEKIKLLKSIRVMQPVQVPAMVVRGQYAAGMVQGESRPAYRQEAKVKPDSNVETYVALKLFIDNWRWSGVPFYLRTGKNMPLSASEIRVQFRQTPNVLFAAQCGPKLDANSITLRLQPNEGITLRFNGKIPGATMQLRPVRMHFSYDAEFSAYTPEAYERLLLDAMGGDTTLFLRSDIVETAWGIVDPIRQSWVESPLTEREFYAAGTWGPPAADDLLACAGHAWRNPTP